MANNSLQRLPDSRLDSFVDNAAAATLLHTPSRSRLLLWVVLAFVVSALFWAGWAQLDEVTVGEGRVIPSQQLQVVQNLEGGIVAEIFVKEGDRVSVGESLLRIDDTRFNSDFRERQQEIDHLTARIARLRTELESIQVRQQAGPVDNWKMIVQVNPQPMPRVFSKAQYNLRGSTLDAVVQREKSQLDERLRNLQNQLVILERQIEQREQELLELESNIQHLKTNYRLVLEELQLTRPLAEQGVVPRVELIKLEREVNKIKQELEGTRLQLPKIQAAVRSDVLKHREAALEHRSETQGKLAEAEAELAQMTEAQVGLRDRVDRTLVVSPVEGIIKKVGVSTVGGVVQPGMDLVEIVPAEDNLLIEAKILPKDIAFLRPGLGSVVRFSAYDFSIYGGLKGELEHISADSIEDDKGDRYYLIRVRTEKNYLGDDEHPLPIIPGMVASVDVMTGKKTVLDYLLKPILRAQQSALRER